MGAAPETSDGGGRLLELYHYFVCGAIDYTRGNDWPHERELRPLEDECFLQSTHLLLEMKRGSKSENLSQYITSPFWADCFRRGEKLWHEFEQAKNTINNGLISPATKTECNSQTSSDRLKCVAELIQNPFFATFAHPDNLPSLDAFIASVQDYCTMDAEDEEDALVALCTIVSDEARRICDSKSPHLLWIKKIFVLEAFTCFECAVQPELQSRLYMVYKKHKDILGDRLWNNWCQALSLEQLQDRVARVRFAINIMLVQMNAKRSSDIEHKLDCMGREVRVCFDYLGALYKSNELRRCAFEDSLRHSETWQKFEVVRDIDPFSLRCLHLPYLPLSEFYVDPPPTSPYPLLEFLLSLCDQSCLGFVANPCSMSLELKAELIAFETSRQQHELGTTIERLLGRTRLVLRIRRDQILNDALNQLIVAQSDNERYKRPLRVIFQNEEGVDAGGLTKEFFQLLMAEIFNPDYGMFTYLPEAGLYWFFKNAFGTLVQFELIGLVIGLAVYNKVVLDLRLPQVLYRKLLAGYPRYACPPVVDEEAMSAFDSHYLALCFESIRDGQVLIRSVATELTPPPPEESMHRNVAAMLSSRLGGLPSLLRFVDGQLDLWSLFLLMKALRSVLDKPEDFVPHMLKPTVHSDIVGEMAHSLPPFSPTIADLDDFMPDVAVSFRKLMRASANEVECMCLTFSVTTELFGEFTTVPLQKPDGTNYDPDWPVTAENRDAYVAAYLDYLCNHSIDREFGAFYAGFHRSCGGNALKKFTPHELQTLLCGIPGDLDFEELKKGATYADGYTADSIQVIWLWEILFAFPQELRKAFLFFTTGSDRTPVNGLMNLRLKITRAGDDQNRLPSTHTCFNYLLLPEYKSKEILEQKLLKALEHRHGFGL